MNYTKWYTLRVLNGKENSVKEYLPHLEDYQKHVEEIFIAQEKSIRVRNNKKIVVNTNLLPGYIFIKFKTIPDPDFIKLIEKTNFVASFLKDVNKRPIPLKDYEFEKIIGNIEISKEKLQDFAAGEDIVVTDGPFEKFKGKIVEILPDKKRLKVTVKVFGRETNLDLNLNQVERVI